MRSTLLLSLATAVVAYDIPANLQTFYNSVKTGTCDSFLGNNGNLNDGQGNSGFGFCTAKEGAVYVSGPGELADMDVDCDGSAECGGDGSFQPETAFDYTLENEGYGISTLDAGKHTYVVLGTCDVDVTTAIKPLSVVAVVCNGQLHYAVFGDENGCDGDNYTGEASIALAKICFPDAGISGNNGHEEHDVLYLAFTSDDAVVGPKGAAWTADDPETFEASLKELGDKMIANVFGESSGSGSVSVSVSIGASVPATATTQGKTKTTTSAAATGTAVCEWAGHCEGATCETLDDCSGDLTCNDGVCGSSSASKHKTRDTASDDEDCNWEGHCKGASCEDYNDCGDPYTCVNGKCGLEASSAVSNSSTLPSSLPTATGIAIHSNATTSGSSSSNSTSSGSSSSSSSNSTSSGNSTSTGDCKWEGHCLGASCETFDDCSDDFICTNGKCSKSNLTSSTTTSKASTSTKLVTQTGSATASQSASSTEEAPAESSTGNTAVEKVISWGLVAGGVAFGAAAGVW